MFACWQTCGYFNIFSNDVNKKTAKKALFLAALPAADSQMTTDFFINKHTSKFPPIFLQKNQHFLFKNRHT